MKRNIRVALLGVLLALNAVPVNAESDNSAQTFYELSETPLSLLDFGMYRLDLLINDQFYPELLDEYSLDEDELFVRTFITVGKGNSEMVLTLDILVTADSGVPRGAEGSQEFCDELLGHSHTFFTNHPIADFFKTKDPFVDDLPDNLGESLERALFLTATTPVGEGLPARRCSTGFSR